MHGSSPCTQAPTEACAISSADLLGSRALLDRQGQDARRPGTPAGADDAFSLLPELSLVIQEERPNPRKCAC